jgi:hypothetical protein
MLTPVPMPAVPRQTRQSKAAAGHHDARTQGEGGDFDAADAEDLERLDEDNQEEDEDDLPEDDTFFAWRQLVAPGSDIQQELTFVKYLSGGAKAANFLLMHEAAAYMGMPTSTVKSAVIRNKLDYIVAVFRKKDLFPIGSLRYKFRQAGCSITYVNGLLHGMSIT